MSTIQQFLQSYRREAAQKLEIAANEATAYEKDLNEIGSILSASSFAQTIGVNALITAAGVGLAGVISRGIRGMYGARLASLAMSESAGGSVVRGVASVGRAGFANGSISTTASTLTGAHVVVEGACGTLGRVAAGLLTDPVSRYANTGTVDYNLDKATAGSLVMVVAGSIFALPGSSNAAVPGGTRLGRFVSKVLASGAPRTALVSTKLMSAAWTTFRQQATALDNDVLELFFACQQRKTTVTAQAKEAATVAADKLKWWVNANEQILVSKAERKAAGVNYNSQVNFLARGSKAVDELKRLSISYAGVATRYHLWHGALRYYTNLEKAVTEFERLQAKVATDRRLKAILDRGREKYQRQQARARQEQKEFERRALAARNQPRRTSQLSTAANR